MPSSTTKGCSYFQKLGKHSDYFLGKQRRVVKSRTVGDKSHHSYLLRKSSLAKLWMRLHSSHCSSPTRGRKELFLLTCSLCAYTADSQDSLPGTTNCLPHCDMKDLPSNPSEQAWAHASIQLCLNWWEALMKRTMTVRRRKNNTHVNSLPNKNWNSLPPCSQKAGT